MSHTFIFWKILNTCIKLHMKVSLTHYLPAADSAFSMAENFLKPFNSLSLKSEMSILFRVTYFMSHTRIKIYEKIIHLPFFGTSIPWTPFFGSLLAPNHSIGGANSCKQPPIALLSTAQRWKQQFLQPFAWKSHLKHSTTFSSGERENPHEMTHVMTKLKNRPIKYGLRMTHKLVFVIFTDFYCENYNRDVIIVQWVSFLLF